MKMKKLAWWLVPLMGMLWLFAAPQSVRADTVNYQVYKYGTNTRSIASGYYVKPAQIQANGDQYLVTMTIHTKTSLGKWPVTVLSINGSGPANVTKTKSASGYDYAYAFETKDLSSTINSRIKINVLHVYAATQNVSFQFDTRKLPSLKTQATTTKPATSHQAAKAASAQASAAKSMNQRSRELAKQIRAVNQEHKRTQTTILMGGSVMLVLLAVSAYFFSKHR
jgi:heme-binding NEAT domain protein